MSDESKVKMLKEIVLRLDQMVWAAVKGICLPMKAANSLHRRYGLRQFYWTVGIVGLAVAFSYVELGVEEAFWKDKTRSEVVRNYGLLVAAVIGGLLAAWRSMINQKQAYTAEQGQITDRYTKAVKMLSDENLRTRVGAVYALARIAQDSTERDHIPVMEVLGEFLRNPPYDTKAEERAKTLLDRPETGDRANDAGADAPPPPIKCPDVHAVLDVFGARNQEQIAHEKRVEFVLHFGRANLLNLDLRGANLAHLRLNRASLRGADLSGAHLNGADLSVADLSGADLIAANLSDANLRRANLSDANLRGAHLIDADLSGVNLGGADLSHARLINADLSHADLSHARLGGADLMDADLGGADLMDADLGGADLMDADLGGANLSRIRGLEQIQINKCMPTKPPINLPNDFTWPFVANGKYNWLKRE